MKKNFITGIVLGSFALICALLLSLVNMLTEKKIEERNIEEINNAIVEVCPYDATKYERFDKTDEYPSDVTDADDIVTYIIKSKEDQSIYACVYQVTKKGFAGDIVMMIAINSNHEIIGYTVVSQSETKGNVQTYAEVDGFNVKNKTNLDDFDKLSGSSVSSKAVYKCLNTALYVSYKDMP